MWRKRRRRRLPTNPSPDLQIIRKEKRSQLARVNVIYGLVFVSFASLILRMGYLQIAKGDVFRSEATATSLNLVPVLPARGYIYDREGNLLAYDNPTYSVYLTQLPHVTQDYRAMSSLMATKFHISADELYQTMEQGRSVATIKLFDHVTDAELSFVLEHQHDLPGINVVLDSKRQYPYGDLAGKVLGYTGAITPDTYDQYRKLGYLSSQKVGQSGIELYYENQLQGKVGYQVVQINSRGTPIRKLGFSPAPAPGQYLQLTLDGPLQAFSQNYMLNFLQNSKFQSSVQSASAVMLDVKTGGVLAMVSYPYLNPNWFPGDVVKHQRYLQKPFVQYNTVIRGAEPPGSTVKPANLLTGLRAGIIDPGSVFPDHMVTMVGTSKINDDGSHGFVSPIYAVTVSCDSFFYHLGLQLGHWFGSSSTYGGGPPLGKTYLSWLHTDFIKGINTLFEGEAQFGLGELSGIDLPGEQAGTFYIDKNFSKVPYDLHAAEKSVAKTGKYDNNATPIDLAFAGIGQSQQFTPIELAQYVGTIANNGIKLQPHLLQAVYPSRMQKRLSPLDKPLSKWVPKVQANLHIPNNHLRIVQQGMYGVCNNPNGTAYGVFHDAPYKAAGKTGTAQLGGNQDNSVFICYAPYDKPQVAVAVMVPGAGYGSDTAVPIAKAMIDQYFKEQHKYFPAKEWVRAEIPADWKTSPAYLMPELSK